MSTSAYRALAAGALGSWVALRTVVAVLAGLRTLARSGASVLLTGHDVEDLLSVADDVIWVAAGTTHGLGSPEEAVRHDQFRREYLGPRAPEGASGAP